MVTPLISPPTRADVRTTRQLTCLVSGAPASITGTVHGNPMEIKMMDIEKECEPAVEALKSWINAVETKDFDRLESLLSDDFVATCNPEIAGGRIGKARFIEIDRHIRESTIEIVMLAARRHGNTVITLLFANIREQFEGDLGSDTLNSAEMTSFLAQGPVAYASAWRLETCGEWRCIQHHIFGPIG